MHLSSVEKRTDLTSIGKQKLRATSSRYSTLLVSVGREFPHPQGGARESYVLAHCDTRLLQKSPKYSLNLCMKKESERKRTSTFILTRSEHLTSNTYKYTSHVATFFSTVLPSLQDPLKRYLFTLGMLPANRHQFTWFFVVDRLYR